ncbi:MAG: hypothetical protein JW797_17840 [Bradymonadales bacterium]|nr:hypothetical protein [Bradymonadales bacterium]
MRTTISIEDELLQRAKIEAARASLSLSQFVENALREVLEGRDRLSDRERPSLPTVRGRLRPGIDYQRFAELSELSEKQTR